VGPRSKCEQRVSRSVEGNSAVHKAMTTKENCELRKDWVNTKLQDIERGRTKTRSYHRVDITRGTYVPFSGLFASEGGKDDPQALECAQTYAKKCLAMQGLRNPPPTTHRPTIPHPPTIRHFVPATSHPSSHGPWTTWSQMTERVEFLLVKKEYKQSFSTCWSLYEKMSEAVPSEPPILDGLDQNNPVGKTTLNADATPTKASSSKRKDPTAKADEKRASGSDAAPEAKQTKTKEEPEKEAQADEAKEETKA
jgi:hypothetical protein